MAKICPICQKQYPDTMAYCSDDGGVLFDASARTAHDPLVGHTLDNRWEILRRLGEGSMGAVYLASQRSVQRTVAIKTLHRTLSTNPDYVQRFFREARVASSLSNPHCVTLYDFGQTTDNVLYFAMEYLEGTTLHDRIVSSWIPIPDVLNICLQITTALSAAHEQRIIHRDLKPENIWLLDMPDQSIFVKVLDFGIAKVLDADVQMTRAGDVYGTPSYMSPEQCRGKDVDGRADLYSLGCVLYEMLTGHPPFDGENVMDIVLAQLQQAPVPVLHATSRTDIPSSLADLCMMLLRKNPDERPANASWVGQYLMRLRDQLSPVTHADGSSTPGPFPGHGVSADASFFSDTQHSTSYSGAYTQIGSGPNASYGTYASTTFIESAHPMPLLWGIILGIVALVIGLGLFSAVEVWIMHGSPDLLFEPTVTQPQDPLDTTP